MSDDCVFCKIAAGEIPSQKEYDDDTCIVFHDINPRAKTHLLIIPKKHIATVMDMEDGDEQIIGHMVKVARDMGKKMGLDGYKLLISVGEKGGQEVFHIHMHLMADQAS